MNILLWTVVMVGSLGIIVGTAFLIGCTIAALIEWLD